jgi:hypothetical protein
MRTQVLAGGVAFMLLGLGSAGPASAQEVLHAPDAIRSCLCQEQSVSALAAQVLQQNGVYEERRKSLEALNEQVRTQRPQVNVNDPQAVDAFKRLLDQRDQAADAFAGPVTHGYADEVAHYNQTVAAFNSQCGGKAYDPEVLAQVRSNLSCPRP